jgi:galactosamine-6-phosphate isomerase
MMDRDFFYPLQLPESQIRFFDAMAADPQRECDQMNRLIASHGGLDVMLAGIGLNGHIAMNEPGTSFDLYAHATKLSEETKQVGQKYFSRPTELSAGLTLGLRHFQEARLPILMANGEKKAPVVKSAITLPPTEQLPATIVQRIPAAIVMLDREAAGLL